LPAQHAEGSFDVLPGRVLGEDGADTDLERRFAGPPVGVAVTRAQALVDPAQVIAALERAHVHRFSHAVGNAPAGTRKLTASRAIPHNDRARNSRHDWDFGGIAEVKMSLEEDLKARTLALISQQMANWVVEIQRNISEHQGNLVRTLDELQETVARY